MPPAEESLRSLLHHAADLAADYLEGLPTRPVVRPASAADLRERLGGPLPDVPAPASAVVSELYAAAEPGIVASTGGRYFGFVEGGVLPAALAADWLTSTWDQNPGMYTLSPAAAVAEEVCAGWLLDLLGLPAEASVGFTTGAQMANLVGLAAGRHHVLSAAGWDVEADGLRGAPELTVVVGAQRHVTIARALRFLGLGEQSAVVVPADDEGRMVARDLAQVLADVDGPVIVCAQAGNVNSGAFDPLTEIAAAARERGAWLHVDGAFGLWAAASPSRRHLTEGAGLADSWATDGHKWLNVPYDCGIVACAHPDSHRVAMSVKAAYLQRDPDAGRDGTDWSPESSRRARAFAVWAALRSLGRSGVSRLVDQSCDQALRFAQTLDEHPEVEILNDVVINQVLVRIGDDERTRQTIQRIQADGTTWMGGTEWQGRAAIRISVSDQATNDADVERAIAAIVAAAGL